MKRLFLMVVAAMLLAIPAVQAQKINREALVAALEKSDAEIQDAKKNGKASTWIKRAQVIFNAISAPTSDLFETQTSALLIKSVGNPKSTESVQIRTGAAEAYNFNWVTVYLRDDKVVAWTQNKQVRKDLFKDLKAALDKAYELDAKQASKIQAELIKAANFYKEYGNVNYEAAKYTRASNSYVNASKLMAHPAYGPAPEASSLVYNAGYLMVIDGTTNPDSFVKAEKLLKKALDMGYNDGDGSVYYYLFHSFYGRVATAESDEAKQALLQQAKEALTEGVTKYPTNENIISSLLGLYMQHPTVGDASELIGMIQAAVERDPNSVEMWSSLALANYQLKDFDACIAAGLKAVELAPEAFETNYRQGIFCAAKGDFLVEKMNNTEYVRQSEYDADYNATNDAYRAALPWLEKAYSINPTNRSVVETLKVIYFRLRDEDGMMDKYNEFNALLQQM